MALSASPVTLRRYLAFPATGAEAATRR